MDYYVIVLRVIHIASGVLWAGWLFSLVGFIEPAARAAGPDGGKFMQTLASKTRLIPVMTAAPILVIISGLMLYWRASANLYGPWIGSLQGMTLTLGGLAGILAFTAGMTIVRPAAAKMAQLGKQIQAAGGPPTAEQMTEIRGLQERLSKGGRYAAFLLVITVIAMAAERYLAI